MPITVGAAAGNKDLAELYVGTDVGNRQIQEAWVGTVSGNRQVYTAVGPLVIDADPDIQSWVYEGDGPDLNKDGVPDWTFYSASVGVSVTGGQGPYSYAWAETTTANIFAWDDAGSATTGAHSAGALVTYVRCTVTDALGSTALSDIIRIG